MGGRGGAAFFNKVGLCIGYAKIAQGVRERVSGGEMINYDTQCQVIHCDQCFVYYQVNRDAPSFLLQEIIFDLQKLHNASCKNKDIINRYSQSIKSKKKPKISEI